MNNEINYYYKILPDKVYKSNEDYYFFYNGKKYYLILYLYSYTELSIIITIINEYNKRNIVIDNILQNIEGSFISSINGKNYILLVKNDDSIDYDLESIIDFDRVLKTKRGKELGYVSWDILWSRKVDYYEEKIGDLINKNELIKKSFDYYIGLSENAISYVKYASLEYNYDILTIGHKRFNKNISNIRNPFNLVIDYEVRDIAEYIKYKFFNETFSFSELESIINKNKYSEYEIRLLIGRLLYPNYYFNLIDDLFKNIDCNNKLNSIINKIDMYEKLLLEIYNYLIEYYKLPKISWLFKDNM